MQAPKDSTSLVGLLECVDGTAAVIGKRHQIVEAETAIFQKSNVYGSVRLTREAGEALYELLSDWLGKDQDQTAFLDDLIDRNAEALQGLKDLGD